MKVTVDQSCPDATTYRAARVKSLFNVEDATRFTHTAALDIDDTDWRIGIIVGPSGSGKTSLGRRVFGPDAMWENLDWPDDAPIVDAIAPDGDFDAVTAALGAVGLGDVPAWLRPYRVLSNGERFRADLARLIAEHPAQVVVDEFSSVVDRQIARVGAGAFAKSWRRTTGQAVLLSCHYDILDWVQPDWVYETDTATFTRGSVQYRRPRIEVDIRQGGWGLWPYFEPHHYLKMPLMVAGRCYVAFIDGEPIAHLGMATSYLNTRNGPAVEARACRMVVLPEWQGAGVGMRFLNECCRLQHAGEGVLPGRRMTTRFHTSHPHLNAALRRDPKWRQMSAALHGASKKTSSRTMAASRKKNQSGAGIGTGYGGHLRAVQGHRYIGEREAA
ncbi:hypothetical protein ACIRLA_46510 [Streptomyces sp. NPDC102364]|uniref:hypothetical protein n=1 Tax=Streptomyces sp. NPDC102364 TaxID=3366161 RepID=UPI003825A1B3